MAIHENYDGNMSATYIRQKTVLEVISHGNRCKFQRRMKKEGK